MKGARVRSANRPSGSRTYRRACVESRGTTPNGHPIVRKVADPQPQCSGPSISVMEPGAAGCPPRNHGLPGNGAVSGAGSSVAGAGPATVPGEAPDPPIVPLPVAVEVWSPQAITTNIAASQASPTPRAVLRVAGTTATSATARACAACTERRSRPDGGTDAATRRWRVIEPIVADGRRVFGRSGGVLSDGDRRPSVAPRRWVVARQRWAVV